MANSAGSRKRARQAEKRRQQNASLRSMARTYLKKIIKALDSGDKAAAEEAFKTAQPILDSSVSKGIFHKNKVARHKSRLSAKIKALA
ncbi:MULTISPECIES: 30S ribosomal protein S20 [Nitrincola]|uniref:Small ribosomal subunit protein bS20 n=2 Tax=Nitrincola TaxID=267849 RepID=A0A364NK40_9GAMM|nr:MULTISPECIES: 30S ribosomal protein S20 [Nitrincola]EXJ10395.1 30S ribosomal protein S20 [Nitrincola nitratireducens]RAU17401.1 30S ribosomal protein S20 [Nitrincola tibetensis]